MTIDTSIDDDNGAHNGAGDIEGDGALAVPTLGPVLRSVRDYRKVSRERLAFNAGVSASYITHLEKGARDRPTREVLDAIIRYLDRVDPLSIEDRRQLRDLAGLTATGCPPLDELKAAVTPELRQVLDQPLPAAITAVGGCVLACNPGWERAFPGMREGGNQFHWLFGCDLARRVMVDWEADATHSVRSFRVGVGGFGGAETFAELLDELSRYPDFRRMWGGGEVADFQPMWRMRLRDLERDTVRTVLVQTGMVQTGAHPGWLVSQFLIPVPS
ncbi:helix-turn-helix domain-containing protein [Nocardia sp. NPDC005825]|uniref:helix-turn-helix domain-containing protein n=1 Tax=unclassified Nocardia TaxID=2637762 RepID=UPI0033F63067